MPGTASFLPASAIQIRNQAAVLVGGIQGLTVFKARTAPTQPGMHPYAVVWNAGERTEPNGDPNTGALEFVHHMTLVVDVMVKAASDEDLDTEVVGFVEAIRTTLMTDPNWVSMVEGITKCDVRYSYPQQANELLVQGMVEFEVMYRSIWEPYLPTTLAEVDVTTPPGALDGFSTSFTGLDS